MVRIELIDRATPSVIRDINVLYRLAGWWGEAPDDPELIGRIVENSTYFVVAALPDRIVGMGRVISDGVSDAYIQDVVVHPQRRGRGIATKMVARLLRALKAARIEWIGLIAEGHSHPFYRRLGFRPMADARPMRYEKE